MGDTEISAEQYFETTPPPTELEERTQQLAAFIQTHLNSKIAFVTVCFFQFFLLLFINSIFIVWWNYCPS